MIPLVAGVFIGCPKPQIEPFENDDADVTRECVDLRVDSWTATTTRPVKWFELRRGHAAVVGRACKGRPRERLRSLAARSAPYSSNARMSISWDDGAGHHELGVGVQCHFFSPDGTTFGRNDQLLLDLLAELPGSVAVGRSACFGAAPASSRSSHCFRPRHFPRVTGARAPRARRRRRATTTSCRTSTANGSIGRIASPRRCSTRASCGRLLRQGPCGL